MNVKYYDILSSLITGYIVLVVSLFCMNIEYDSSYSVAYIAGALAIGYIINAVSSLLETFYYFTIGGKPSEKLLTKKKGKDYTGIRKVRFYHCDEVTCKLRKDLQDENATIEKMFSHAKSQVSGNNNSRVPDFNAHYAYARSFLTIMLLFTIGIIAYSPCNWHSYLTIVPLIICWNRYREKGYYYAREVLNEYLKQQTIKK